MRPYADNGKVQQVKHKMAMKSARHFAKGVFHLPDRPDICNRSHSSETTGTHA